MTPFAKHVAALHPNCHHTALCVLLAVEDFEPRAKVALTTAVYMAIDARGVKITPPNRIAEVVVSLCAASRIDTDAARAVVADLMREVSAMPADDANIVTSTIAWIEDARQIGGHRVPTH